MLLEIHMLQNHAPSNLNRDDTGSPKDAVFGGVRRSRISSQALKRAIRRSPVFENALVDVGLGVRTRQLPQAVRNILLERGLSEEMADIGAVKASGFGTKDGKEQKVDPERNHVETAQIMYLTPQDIEAVADVIFEAAQEAKTPAAFKKISAKDLQARARDRWRPITPDVALFGRMITSDAFRDVESAVQVAHALSTHRMEHEFDYYTAVDDLRDPMESEDEKGAAMIGDVEFTSACYYKYFNIDLDGFVDNLVGAGDIQPEERQRARRLAEQVALAFLEAAVFTTPSGKQNTFAAHQLPDAILVEVRDRKVPVSFANAFVKPVVAGRGEDLVQRSIAAFKEHVELLTDKFSLKSSARLWFTTRDLSIDGTRLCASFDELMDELRTALRGGGSDG